MEAPAAPGEQVTRLLHISDLHFGMRFGRTYWDNLVTIAAARGPHLVVVTGDLVNNPFFWTLRKARRALEALKQSIREKSEPTCEVVVIPGNHDTRISGLFPVRWLTVAVAILVAIALLCWFWRNDTIVAMIATGLAVAGLAIRALFRSFTKEFKDYVATEPKPYENLGLFLLPFDSARRSMRSARGRVDTKLFARAAEKADLTQHPGLYRIALLHHHPLPIPYNDKAEALLVLENAGAFLNEMAKLRVRLVLHGHKHHTNFARYVVPHGDGDFELGVLAAGTPTAEHDARPGLTFHLLTLQAGGRLDAVTYQAQPGGLFSPGRPFAVEDDELWWRRVFEGQSAKAGCEYGSVHAFFLINDDGDCFSRRHYLDFRIVRPGLNLTTLPDGVGAEASESVGHIERLEEFHIEGTELPGLKLDIDTSDPARHTVKRQQGTLRFGQTLDAGSRPVSFGIAFHALNSYALSASQFGQMYGEGQAPLEMALYLFRQIPTRELVLTVSLPESCKLRARPDLYSSDAREQVRLPKLSEAMTVDHTAGIMVCRIPYPLVGVEYALRWRVPQDRRQTRPQVLRRRGESFELASGILAAMSTADFRDLEPHLVGNLVDEATKMLKLRASEQLDTTLMVYDQRLQALRVIAATFPPEDLRRASVLRFGDGLAGRAFKTGRARIFVKQKALLDGTPMYFFPNDGKPVDPAAIREEALLALPLSHPKQRAAVYGVLNLSSTSASSGLIAFLDQLNRINKFWMVANRTCFDVLGQVQSQGGAE